MGLLGLLCEGEFAVAIYRDTDYDGYQEYCHKKSCLNFFPDSFLAEDGRLFKPHSFQEANNIRPVLWQPLLRPNGQWVRHGGPVSKDQGFGALQRQFY